MPSQIFINSPKNALLFPPPNHEILAFHKTLPQYSPTPLIPLPAIAKELGVAHVLLKDESSRLGLPAFKILGASYAIYKALIKRLNLKLKDNQAIPLDVLAASAQEAGIVLFAATDGNHGRAVARMAQYLGISARIFVPEMVDEEAKSKIVAEGAHLEIYHGDYDQTVLHTKTMAALYHNGRGLLISDTALEEGDEVPAWIVEGYQTMFDEMEEQVLEVTGGNEIACVVTPVGVGSLAQAVVTHFSRRKTPTGTTSAKVMAVEPAAAACLKTSLEKGEMTSVETAHTICTGMCCGTLSITAWPILRDGVDFAVTVEDREVYKAIQKLEEYGVLAGPCGAACLAGLWELVRSEVSVLDTDAVVVLLCTEGKRGYEMRE